ncbi:hypothetical protein ACSBR2_025054 [Camellia fascicularis]
MTNLAIADNNFTGMLPSSLSNLGNLISLQAEQNNFEGIIVDFLTNSKHFAYLLIRSNIFSGPFLSLVANLTTLLVVDLSHNHLIGPLPSQLIGLPNLTRLSLDNNLINGTVPSWVFSLPALNYLNLNNNKLIGHVKQFKSTYLTVVDLSNNNLHGRFPTSTFKLVDLVSLILSSNSFSGDLDMLCHAVSLEFLVLSSNSFNGAIPQCLGYFSIQFSVLDLRKNNFYGTIPDIFAMEITSKLSTLMAMDLRAPVPNSLVNCKALQVLDLECNKFSDQFPYWLEHLGGLRILSLKSNKFHGPILTSNYKFPFPSLRVMDLSDNYFTSPLPKIYFNNFNATMNVSEDSFGLDYLGQPGWSTYYYDCLTIVIEGTTLDMVMLDHWKPKFNLGAQLVSQQPYRTYTDLSSNKLIGKIPQQLKNLMSLEVLNISQNQITGLIPQGNQFDTFSDDSYNGNLALCGHPLLNTCSNQQEDDTHFLSRSNWDFISLGYGCGLVLGLVMGYLTFSIGKPQWLVRIIEGEQNKSGKRFEKHSHRSR